MSEPFTTLNEPESAKLAPIALDGLQAQGGKGALSKLESELSSSTTIKQSLIVPAVPINALPPLDKSTIPGNLKLSAAPTLPPITPDWTVASKICGAPGSLTKLADDANKSLKNTIGAAQDLIGQVPGIIDGVMSNINEAAAAAKKAALGFAIGLIPPIPKPSLKTEIAAAVVKSIPSPGEAKAAAENRAKNALEKVKVKYPSFEGPSMLSKFKVPKFDFCAVPDQVLDDNGRPVDKVPGAGLPTLISKRPEKQGPNPGVFRGLFGAELSADEVKFNTRLEKIAPLVKYDVGILKGVVEPLRLGFRKLALVYDDIVLGILKPDLSELKALDAAIQTQMQTMDATWPKLQTEERFKAFWYPELTNYLKDLNLYLSVPMTAFASDIEKKSADDLLIALSPRSVEIARLAGIIRSSLWKAANGFEIVVLRGVSTVGALEGSSSRAELQTTIRSNKKFMDETQQSDLTQFLSPVSEPPINTNYEQ